MNWKDKIDKNHKGQTGFFKQIEQEQLKQNKMELEFEFVIIWKGEEVDIAETRNEALYLVKEYALAFKSPASMFEIIKRRA